VLQQPIQIFGKPFWYAGALHTPSRVPSAEAPLSPTMYMKIVLSQASSSLMDSMIRPTWHLRAPGKPAYTSISREATGLYLSGYSSQDGRESGRDVRVVPGGMIPASNCRWWVSSRSLSSPGRTGP